MNAPSEKSESQLNYELVSALATLRAICDDATKAVRLLSRGVDYAGDGSCPMSSASMDLHYAMDRVREADRALARFYSGE
jgi:hypothetical protein